MTFLEAVLATPLPVVIKSMTPEVVRSLPPVVIKALPPVVVAHTLEGPNPWFAFIAPVLLTAAAVTIGIWTLRKVYDQIKLANDQLGIANDQLRIANEELTAVRDDFALGQEQFRLSQEQFAYITREPKLEVTLSVFEDKVEPFGRDEKPCRQVVLEMGVVNRGEKIALDVVAQVFIPTSLYFTHVQLAQGLGESTVIEGEKYQALSRALRLPAGARRYFRFQQMFEVEPSEFNVWWGAEDSERSYPPGGYGCQSVKLNPWKADGSQ